MWDLSSPTRDRTHAPWTARLTLNPWATRDIRSPVFPSTKAIHFSVLHDLGTLLICTRAWSTAEDVGWVYGFAQVSETVREWPGLYMECFVLFHLVEKTGSITWGTPLPFSNFDVTIKVTEVWNNCIHPEESWSLPFTDVANMQGEPMEDRTVNGEVSPPAQTFAIVWAPPMPSGSAFEDHVSVHHSHLSPLRTLQQKTWYMLTWTSGPSPRDGSLPLPWGPCTPLSSPLSMRNST